MSEVLAHHHFRISPAFWLQLCVRLARFPWEDPGEDMSIFGVPVVVDPTVKNPPGYIEENKPAPADITGALKALESLRSRLP